MSAYQSEALTLRTYSYSESHKIAVFFTRNFGQVRGVAYGALKPKSHFGSSLEPLTYSRLTFSRREHQDLATIQGCEILRAYSAAPLSWELHLYFGYFSELLLEFSREEVENEKLFRLTLAVLDTATEGADGPGTPQNVRGGPPSSVSAVAIEVLARYFELWLLRFEGVLPPLSENLPPELATKTDAMMRLHPRRLKGFDLASGESKRLGSLTNELIEYHLEKGLKTRGLLNEFL